MATESEPTPKPEPQEPAATATNQPEPQPTAAPPATGDATAKKATAKKATAKKATAKKATAKKATAKKATAKKATAKKATAKKATAKKATAKKATAKKATAKKATAKKAIQAAETDDATVGSTSETLFGEFGVGDFRPSDLMDTAREVAATLLRQPEPMLRAYSNLGARLLKIWSGQSELKPERRDRRFADETWQSNPYYKGLLQTYLAWSEALQEYASGYSDDPQACKRVSFLMSQITDALAPTNSLLGNPAALRKAMETNGQSLRDGMQNMLEDFSSGRKLPAQSDDRPFKLGKNLACTPGSVVYRTEMFEILQYAPQTDEVYETPVLVVPPIVNKYYVLDLSPGRSIAEFMVKNGISMFVLVWRNPGPEHDHWGEPEYQDAVDEAIDVVREISNQPLVNVWGSCGVSPTVVSVLGWHAATGNRKVNSLMLLVPVLDTSSMSDAEGIGGFADPEFMERMEKATPRTKRRVSADELGVMFALLRPNDLIWNYWVNNYLMGNQPPVFDILTWNGDGSGMTAQYSADFNDIIRKNPLVRPGAVKVHGTPIAPLDQLNMDSYVVGAATDHIVRWPMAYTAARMLGERSRFILGSSGHIQTLVCPPENPKAAFFTNPDLSLTPEQWHAGATLNTGSWWVHGLQWMAERSGNKIPAPAEQGSTKYPVLDPAPGKYVLEKR